MSYQYFLDAVTKEMRSVVAADETVTLHTVLKNNGIKMKAMSIKHKSQEVCPLIYMTPFYRMYSNGRKMEDIVKELKNLYQMKAGGLTDSRIFFSFHTAKAYLAYRIVRYESNKELLKQIPHRKLLDFAVIYYLSLEGKDEIRGSAMVYNDHMKSWGVTEKELYETAVVNTPKILPVYTESLDAILEDFLFAQNQDKRMIEEQGIYVISNRYNFYGAAAVWYPGALRTLTEALKCDLYLLPGSVHEFLAVPVSCGMEEDELRVLVRKINMTHVAPEDVLSDNIYRYQYDKDQILLI